MPASSSSAPKAGSTFLRSTASATRASRGARVGAARRVLPVDGRYSMAGYSLDAKVGKRSTTALYARALVLEDAAGHTVAFVSTDLWCASRYLHEAVASRTRVGASGLDVHQIVLLGTHTHTAPGGYLGNSLWDNLASAPTGFHAALAEAFADAIAAAIDEAWSAARPATLRVGTGQLWGVSRNRSLEAFRENPEAIRWTTDASLPGHGGGDLSATQLAVDPRVVVLSAWDAQASCIGALASFACHNTALGNGEAAYDADWAGVAATALEAGGVPVMLVALSGAGDQTPLPPEDAGARYEGPPGAGKKAQGRALARFVGQAVAEKVRAVLGQNLPAQAVTVQSWYQSWTPKPCSRVGGAARTRLAAWNIGAPAVAGAEDGRSAFYTLGLEWEGHALRNPSPLDDPDQFPKIPAGALFGFLARRLKLLAPSPALPLHVVRLGDHVFGTVPGEPTVAMAAQIEAELCRVTGAKTASVLGYAGDYAGYFTTGAEYRAQHYEGALTLYGRNSGAHLVARLGALASGAPYLVPPRRTVGFETGAVLREAGGSESPDTTGSTSQGGRVLGDRVAVWWLWEGAAPAEAPVVQLHAVVADLPHGEPILPRRVRALPRSGWGLAGWYAEFVLPQGMGQTWVRATAVVPPPLSAAPVDLNAPPDSTATVLACIRQDPLSTGRRLWSTVGSRNTRPTDEQALALSEAYLRALSHRGGPEGVSVGDLQYLFGDPPDYGHTLPVDFGFPGYDPVKIPVDPNNWRFQEGPDMVSYISKNAALYALGALKMAPARRPANHLDFSYALPDSSPNAPVELAFFSDFGNGLHAARYLARQITAEPRLAAALHLGDVYYNGKTEEYKRYFAEPLAPLYPRVPLYVLAGNHDLYSTGTTFHDLLDDKRERFPAVQRQRGHSWRLVNKTVQIVGIDCQWDHNGRIPRSSWVYDLLESWLVEARAAGRFSVLCTSKEGWDFGGGTTRLHRDLADLVRARGLVDLWFWGNVHHAALYGPGEKTGPFYASCIGHGGYPYQTLRREEAPKSAAPVRWAEYGTRYGAWKDGKTGGPIRPDMGNNGWCKVLLHAGGEVELRYVDWTGVERHRVVLRKEGERAVERL